MVTSQQSTVFNEVVKTYQRYILQRKKSFPFHFLEAVTSATTTEKKFIYRLCFSIYFLGENVLRVGIKLCLFPAACFMFCGYIETFKKFFCDSKVFYCTMCHNG